MRELRSFGSVRGEGGNVLTYSEQGRVWAPPCSLISPGVFEARGEAYGVRRIPFFLSPNSCLNPCRISKEGR